MKSNICPACGALISYNQQNCNYCKSPLEFSSNLSVENKKQLISFILGTEKILIAVKKKNDSKILISFIILFFTWSGGSYYLYKNIASINILILLILAWGFFIFILFGSFVIKWEEEAMKEYFENKLSEEISKYLYMNNFTKLDFKLVAMEVLAEKSELNGFISEL